MNALLDVRADQAAPEAGDGMLGAGDGPGDEEHVLEALYGDEADVDTPVDAALLALPDVPGVRVDDEGETR
ncbi:hypothetical protein LWC33_16935 [Pseudonocardia sp. RS11V-5]|uniref:hypothetical protein n=1 Tax=Pseudonocardia terrae TaxID=2905831 RepID=UPI001E5E6070|nr:hypothetical protein [Pseudonocardia terrae]MCE3553136.1 hypothetical protein [Pseudonocardia terrae]